MLLSPEQFRAAFPNADSFICPALNRALVRYDIQSPVRLAAFLAQLSVESTGLTKFEESLYYTDATRAANLFRTAFDKNKDRVITPDEVKAAEPYLRNTEKMANKVYANRMGNGDEASGDGFKYRGRGPIMNTGKDAYVAAGAALNLDLVNHPELLADPQYGLQAAGWFWLNHSLNGLADVGRFDDITRTINPGMAAVAERRTAWDRMKKVVNG